MRLNCYMVVSPEMTEGGYGYEPPETYCCAVMVEAMNEADAKIIALKTPEMADWVKEARWNDQTPFSGLVVETLSPCPHGIYREEETCESCEKEDEEFWKETEKQ